MNFLNFLKKTVGCEMDGLDEEKEVPCKRQVTGEFFTCMPL
jgi:hypothetical protein